MNKLGLHTPIETLLTSFSISLDSRLSFFLVSLESFEIFVVEQVSRTMKPDNDEKRHHLIGRSFSAGFDGHGHSVEPLSSSLLDEPLHHQAIRVWAKRVKVLCVLQFITTSFVFASRFWYVNFIGWVAMSIGFVGTVVAKNEFLFVHLVLLVLNAIKNIAVAIFFIALRSPSPFELFLVVILFFDAFVFSIANFYCSFFLYMNLKTIFHSLTYDS